MQAIKESIRPGQDWPHLAQCSPSSPQVGSLSHQRYEQYLPQEHLYIDDEIPKLVKSSSKIRSLAFSAPTREGDVIISVRGTTRRSLDTAATLSHGRCF